MSYTFYNYEQANTPDWNRRGEIAQMRIVRIKHYCGRDEASFTGNLLSFPDAGRTRQSFMKKLKQKKPHIVFILADDLGWNEVTSLSLNRLVQLLAVC